MAFLRGHNHFKSHISASTSRSFTVYVDNLPNGVGMPWFHKFFSNFGFIKDAYLPNRRSKRTGFRFGFVRYDSTRDAQQAMVKANGIWIGKRMLIVERAAYDKGYSSSSADANLGISMGKGKFNPSHVNYNYNQYLDDGGRVRKNDIEHRFTLNVQPIASEWLTRSAVAKLKDLTSPEIVQKAFNELGFCDVTVKSMGGLNLVVTFQSKDDRLSAFHNPVISNWFSSFKSWNGEVAGVSRLIWLNCRGMPLNAWNVLTFKRIAALWGDFITLDVETMKEEAYEVGRCLIATDCVHKIEEGINISVRGRNHLVRVWEEDCNDIFSAIPVSDRHQKQLVVLQSTNNSQKKKGDKGEADDIGEDGLPIREVVANDNVDNVDSPLVTMDFVDPSVHVVAKDLDNIQRKSFIDKDTSSPMKIQRTALNLVDAISEKSEESFVGESPELGYNQQAITGINVAQLGHANNVVEEPPKCANLGPTENSMLPSKCIDLNGEKENMVVEKNENVHLIEEGSSNGQNYKLDDALFDDEATLDNPALFELGCSRRNIAEDNQVISSNDVLNEEGEHNHNEFVEVCPHADFFDCNSVSIQATVKGAKGKKKRKNIDEILGNPKVNKWNQKGRKGSKKCVVFRSAIAAAALSASVSTEGISNRNKNILSEAQAIRQMNRIIGYKYDGEDEEVISKIAELEAQDKEGMKDKILTQ